MIRPAGPSRPRSAAAFTLIEAVMAVVIVSVMVTAMLNTIAASRATLATLSDRAQGLLLAQELTSEIVSLPYREPGTSSSTIGRSAAEAAPGNRSLFDDCDDYHAWTESPPRRKDGSIIPGAAAFTRSVSVVFVRSTSLDTASSSDTGVKRITVTVLRGTRPVAELVSLRTSASLDPAADFAASIDLDP